MEQFPIIAQAMLWIVALNVVLSGISKGLDLIKDKTATKLDNNAAAALNRLSVMLQKVIDMVGYNPKH